LASVPCDHPGSGKGKHWLAGARLIDIFGGRLGTKNLAEAASESGSSLIEELGELLADDRKPIYVILKNVPPLQTDDALHLLILPLDRKPDDANLVIMVYQVGEF
jgi:hypothetical protein